MDNNQTNSTPSLRTANKRSKLLPIIVVVGVLTALIITVVLALTAANPTFDNKYIEGKPTIIFFSKSWCIYCKQMQPIFGELEEELGEDINFLYYDIEKDEKGVELAIKYEITGVPVFVFLDPLDLEQSRLIGARTKTKIIDVITSLGWVVPNG